jgi:dTDP-glucose 4,6-dehydratase
MNPLAKDLDHVLEHTQGLWEELRGQRIFITGGTGFFGCWLLESLLWANDKLGLNASAVVLTRNPAAFRRKAPHLAASPAVRLHSGDVRSFDFPSGDFSHVIHAAADYNSSLDDDDPLLMFDTVAEGTRRVLEFARHCGTRKFLLTSSGAIYGPQSPTVTHMPEDYSGSPDLSDPRAAYGEGKRAAEMLCTLYAREHGLEPKIARCFAFVGPYMALDVRFAVGNFIRDGLRGGPILVRGDGSPVRSYLYAADLMVWLWTILFRGQACCPYNVGSEHALTVADAARAVAAGFGPPPQVIIAQRTEGGSLAERYVPQTARAKQQLGLSQEIDLPEAIARSIVWAKKMDQRARDEHLKR